MQSAWSQLSKLDRAGGVREVAGEALLTPEHDWPPSLVDKSMHVTLNNAQSIHVHIIDILVHLLFL